MDAAPTSSSRLLKSATRASVAVSTGLVLAKGLAWLTTGSVSIFASLLDSLMDTLTSLTNMFAVNYSLKPPDEDHRFGHGKAEALAGLLQAMFIAASACFLLYHAAVRLLDPQPLTDLAHGIWIIVGAIIATAALVTFQRYVIRRTHSTAIRADSLHYVTDLATNAATLVALYATQLGFDWADGLFGGAIGLVVLYSAGRIGLTAVRLLMDEELPQQERAEIVRIANAIDGVVRVRRLRSWRSGQRAVIQLDLVFDSGLSLPALHHVMAQVSNEICAIDPDADVSIQPVPDTATYNS